uniref:RHG40/28/18 C-terminal ubiquitin-like domain-containing protein n=1 Tax=Neogobius melanostomus TaxID=47308 RepID=A0A8C6SUD6_9GOBI
MNRMSLWNVSMVMAPNLFHGDRRQEVRPTKTFAAAMATLNPALCVMSQVPCFLLAQVRRMNQASNRRRAPSRVRKRPQQDAPPLCDDVIRVRAPLQVKVSTAMRLDTTTTARNVTERFPRDAHSGETLRLYEAGGNIGERRLQPDCLLLDVYRVNPGCDWLIKP